MRYKPSLILMLLSLFMLLLLALPAQAAEQAAQPIQQNGQSAQPTSQPSQSAQPSQPSGPLSGLVQDDGIKPLKPIDLNALGDKVLAWGNKSYDLLKKGSVPMFVWSMSISLIIILLGIILGKKTVAAGIMGILLSLFVLAIVHFMPEIAITVKDAIKGALF